MCAHNNADSHYVEMLGWPLNLEAHQAVEKLQQKSKLPCSMQPRATCELPQIILLIRSVSITGSFMVYCAHRKSARHTQTHTHTYTHTHTQTHTYTTTWWGQMRQSERSGRILDFVYKLHLNSAPVAISPEQAIEKEPIYLRQ